MVDDEGDDLFSLVLDQRLWKPVWKMFVLAKSTQNELRVKGEALHVLESEHSAVISILLSWYLSQIILQSADKQADFCQ